MARVLMNFLKPKLKFNVNVLEGNRQLKIIASNSYSIDVSKAEGEQLTMSDLKLKLVDIMGVEKGYKSRHPSRSHLEKYLPKSQNELTARAMQESFSSAVVPLSTNDDLQNKYVSFLGNVRLGRLMEDMDIFAVWVAMKHINPDFDKGDPFPYTLVTVLVDKVDFTEFIPNPYNDIRLSGHVSWVGSSSVEVVVWLEQEINNVRNKITRALFLMAARNTSNTRAALVNQLKPTTPEEEKIIAGGEQRKKRRRALNTSLLKVIPNEEEQHIIHNIWAQSVDKNDPSLSKQIFPNNSTKMANTIISNIILSQPEDRNLHNKVFGGFLMKNALELSWTCGWLFSKYRPILKHISDIAFHKPVDVNSLIWMHSQVVYTEANFMEISVHAEVTDPQTRELTTTNVFNYTYTIPERCPLVIPTTYNEAMLLLQGRRRLMAQLDSSQNTG